MHGGVVKSLLALASLSVKRAFAPRFMARFRIQLPRPSLTPPPTLFPSKITIRIVKKCRGCKDKKYRDHDCPDHSGRRKPPCKKPRKCPPHKPHVDRCDPWEGTRRAKNYAIKQKYAKHYRKKYGWRRQRPKKC